MAPIDNPISTLKGMTNFNVSLRQIFEGQAQWSDTLPWYYTPKIYSYDYTFGCNCWRDFGNYYDVSQQKGLVLLFCSYFYIRIPNILDSNKQIKCIWWMETCNFTYPPLVALSALGINALVESINNKYIKIVVIAAFGNSFVLIQLLIT